MGDHFLGVQVVHADRAAAVAAIGGQGTLRWLRARVWIGTGERVGHAMETAALR